jgi:16S rRNA (cytidine1402-2'-O)-methyltransferase
MDKKGNLYVVATPIGNTEDITLRALRILGTADRVAAEDTRHTGRFLARHDIHAKLVSYHEYNERERTPELIAGLLSGESVALVSNAGTPSVSDPGYRLVKEAIENDIRVVPVPGVSAAVTALSASGLATDTFVFIGFPPKKKGKRAALLESLSDETGTLIFYESPKRILSFMAEIIAAIGDRYGVLSREMTKLHEEFLRGPLSEIISELTSRDSVKGECTLLVKGCGEDDEAAVSMENLTKDIENGLEEGTRLSELSKKIAKKYGISRQTVYEEAVKKKKEGTVGLQSEKKLHCAVGEL